MNTALRLRLRTAELLMGSIGKPSVAASKYDMLRRVPVGNTAKKGARQIKNQIDRSYPGKILEIYVQMGGVDSALDGSGYDRLLCQDLEKSLTEEVEALIRQAATDQSDTVAYSCQLEVEGMSRDTTKKQLPASTALFKVWVRTF